MSAQTPKYQQDLIENASSVSEQQKQHGVHKLEEPTVDTVSRTSNHDNDNFEAFGLDQDELETAEAEQTTDRIRDDQTLQNSGNFNKNIALLSGSVDLSRYSEMAWPLASPGFALCTRCPSQQERATNNGWRKQC